MKPPDLGATLLWPNVPAVYGWLSLDRRGRWRLRGETVSHHGAIDFFNRQYGHDENGRYFVQNGPQRVFVALDYTPWILRLDTPGVLLTHTGKEITGIHAACMDETGNLLLNFEAGIGLLDDRDLPAMLGHLHELPGTVASEAALLALLERNDSAAATTPTGLTLNWQGLTLPLMTTRRAEVAARFGFVAQPVPLTK